jgi:hypothetical protein
MTRVGGGEAMGELQQCGSATLKKKIGKGRNEETYRKTEEREEGRGWS